MTDHAKDAGMTTDSARHHQIGEIYFSALELAPQLRADFIKEACGEDHRLRQEVESLLASNQQAGEFMAEPALELIAGQLAEHQERELVGKSLDHYFVISMLGSGGMAEVYLAEDTRLHRKVALKLLPAAFSLDADRAGRFEQEARTVSRLNHPNIVTIYEIGRFDDRQYIATELIEGTTLREAMIGGLKLQQVLDVMMQVASALTAAHSAGVVHRDIKPENIMLRPDGYAKVLDFGLAKMNRSKPEADTNIAGRFSTAEGVLLGTAGYMSPEQVRGQEVDSRADLFSLGAVLFELLTGRGPFISDTPADTVAAILERETPSIRALLPELPVDLDLILNRMLSKARETRYQSAAELISDLRRVRLELEFGSLKQIQAGENAENRKTKDLPTKITSAMRRFPSSSSTAFARILEPVGGAVPLDSGFYVTRSADAKFKAAISRQDSIVLVKGPRQVGKTSLLARGLDQARRSGAMVVLTDLQNISTDSFSSIEKLLLAFADCFADQLDLTVAPADVWKSNRSPIANFEKYLRQHVLLKSDGNVVWALDEIDRLFTTVFGTEIFGLFRSWHNKRALDAPGPWRRLTLAIAYATEAHLFITDLNQSPFNVGTRLVLEDFDSDQVRQLNVLYGSPLTDDAQLSSYMRLVSGQPYLVRRGLYEMVANGFDLPSLEVMADQDEGPFGDHLRRMSFTLSQDPDLSEVVRCILRGEQPKTAETFYRLRSAGVVVGDSARDARLRCQLYASYLERHLL